MEPLRFVGFDFDGTLTDYLRADQRAVEAARQQMADHLDPAEFFEASGEEIMHFHVLVEQGRTDPRTMHEWRFRSLARRLNLPPPPDQAVAAYRATLLRDTTPVGGAVDLLESLTAQGIRVAIVTNASDGAEQRARIGACFPHIAFDALIIAGEGTRLKPDAEPFRRLIAELSEPANSGLFIGDSPRHDVPGALEVGLPVVIANASESVRRNARELGAATVASLSELAPGILLRIPRTTVGWQRRFAANVVTDTSDSRGFCAEGLW